MLGVGVILLRSFSRPLFATFLILCVAATPICTARCASTLCAPSLPGQPTDSCHHSTSNARESSGLAYKSARLSCTNTQFFFTLPRLENLTASLMYRASVPAVLLHLPNHTIFLGRFAPLALSIVSIPISAPAPLRI